jgi:hypothetical protein
MEKKKILNIGFCYNIKLFKLEENKEKAEKYLEFDSP